MEISRRRSFMTLAAAAYSGSAVAQNSSNNRPPPPRLIVLDVGGTIIEERGDVPEALRAAFASEGATVTAAEINEVRGASKREVVRKFVAERLPKGDQEKLIDTIYRDFSKRINEAYRTAHPIAGAEDAFRLMHKRGLLLATTTGFDRQITGAIFQRLGWQDYFVTSVSADDVAMGRPAPFMIYHAMEAARIGDVRRVIAVGDTPLDLQAGTNAGLRGVVGVLSGASTAEKMEREPHTDILKSVADLPALLESKYS